MFPSQVDVTHVQQVTDNTKMALRSSYLCNDDNFGHGSETLHKFLKEQADPKRREVSVDGIDAEGTPVTHKYILYEDKIEGQTSARDLTVCLKLARDFVTALLGSMDWRYKDLASLSGRKLFKQSHYPQSPNKRQRKCLAWLQMLWDMFKQKPGLPDTLPGLMMVSLLKYDLDFPELIRLWRCSKKRRPAKEVVMAAGLRPVKHSKKEKKALAKAAAASAAAEAAATEKESARVEAEEGGWHSGGKTKASAPLDLDNPFDEEDTVDSSSSSPNSSNSSDSSD
ncbi:unnamed protein product [Closterium sp. NIES-53]